MRNMTISLSYIRIFSLAALTLSINLIFAHTAYADPLSEAINSAGNIFNSIMDGLSAAIGAAISTAQDIVGAILGGAEEILNAIGLGPIWGIIADWLFGAGTCGQVNNGSGPTVGDTICNIVISSEMLPGFISAIGYIVGLICAVTGLVKLKDHVLMPNQVPLSDSIKRFVAGGAFFTIPMISSAAKNLITGTGSAALEGVEIADGAFVGAPAGGYGLDMMMFALLADIVPPLIELLSAFSYLAGLVLVLVGISRVLKTAQEGPRGPTGVGTIMTFVTAGVLFSLDGLMGAFSNSMFASSTVATYGVLSQSTGDLAVDDHIQTVITSVLAFMYVMGWISFIRGFFILRDVSEGNGQASLMASMTHIFGGALAVNLGPMLNAVQSSLGLDGFGIAFSI